MSPRLLVDGQEFTIEQDTWEAWKRLADPFTDTPDAVLRRQFGLNPAEAADAAEAPAARAPAPSRARRSERGRRATGRTRVASHAILPEHAYYAPILRVIADTGGSCEARLVVEEVGRQLQGRLTPVDHQELPNGGTRWRSRVQFARLRLVKDGLLCSDSPRGIWQISDAGRRALERQELR